MKIFSITLKTIVFLSLICITAKSWQLLTDGFRKDKINSDLSVASQDMNIPSEIDEILDQKFKYLSKGCQTYVFESFDQNYVIKFVRFHRYKIPLWLRVSSFLEKHKNKRLYYKDKLLQDSLKSYEIAYNYLKDETATIYVHLNKTGSINKNLQLFDRLNRKYLVDLDTSGFIIQKKVKTLQDVLNHNKNSEIELKKLAHSFLYTTKSLYQKGFINDDYNCVKNSGFIDGKVIHTDLGSFLPKDHLMEKQNFENEFYRFVRYFKKWSDKNAPFLSTYVDEEIKKMAQML